MIRFRSNDLIQTCHSRRWRGNRMACVKIPMRHELSCVVVRFTTHGDLSDHMKKGLSQKAAPEEVQSRPPA